MRAFNLLTLLALGTMTISSDGALGEGKMGSVSTGEQAGERVYVGRFSIEVPQGARRYSQEYKIRDLTVHETQLTAPGESGWAIEWENKRKQIAKLKERRLIPEDRQGDIKEIRVLEPGRLAVIVYYHDTAAILTIAGLRASDTTRGIWVSTVAGLSFIPAFTERVPVVANAYEPIVEGKRPADSAFYLENGAINLAPDTGEEAHAVFKMATEGIEIKLTTRTTAKPKGGGLLSRFVTAVAKAGAAFSAGSTPVKSGGRTAAGLKGEQFIMRASEEKKLYFMWEFAGEANSATRPRIQLEMIAREQENTKLLMAQWDRLVESLKFTGGVGR